MEGDFTMKRFEELTYKETLSTIINNIPGGIPIIEKNKKGFKKLKYP